MARRIRSQAKSSKGLRSALFTGLLVAACYLGGPGFSVKGTWDGQLTDAKTLPKGLGPEAVSGLALGEQYDNGLVNIAVQDGHLVVNYAEGPLSLQVDDEQAWQANFTRPSTALRVSGRAAEDLKWDISKHSDVEGLGAVDVNVSSGQNFGVAVTPSLPDLKGTKVRALARSHGGEVQARIEATRQLMEGVDLSYGVENEEGNYDLERLSHDARLTARLDAGEAVLSLAGDKEAQRYNLTLSRDLGKLLHGDADAVLGADNDGVYGAFAGRRAVGQGLTAGYRTSFRAASKEADPSLAHAASLSHELGTLTLSQATGGPVSAQLESDVKRGPLRAQGRVVQTLGGEVTVPTYNLTLTRDLADLIGSAAQAQVGLDDASLDGLYGRLAARRDLGHGASVEYASAGRVKSLEHSVKVANDLGFARVVKSPESAPRLQLGYEFNA
jgi:hypothetical protein